MQIYEKRKYNTKKIRKIKYIFVTVTTHTLGCSGWLLDHLMLWGGYLCISIAYAEACQMLHLS